MVAHESDVFWVIFEGVLEGKWDLFSVDWEDRHSIVKQFLIEFIILEFFPSH